MAKRILLIYSNYSSFVKADYEILSDKYNVDKYRFIPTKKLFPFVGQFVKQFFFLLFNGWKYDVFFSWFADYHSFLPVTFARLLRKRSVIIVGGFDAVAIPVIQFGVFYDENIRTKLVRLSYRMANCVLPVDETLIKSTNFYVSSEGQKIGFLNFVKKIRAEVEAIPTGYNPNFWKREECVIERHVITVGGCSDIKTFRRKGHDFFMKVAEALPDRRFTLVGISDNLLSQVREMIPTNVKVYGFQNQAELKHLFATHKVFTQFSLSEGLPNTLCEAMLCGCIPVGSNVNGIPTAIGETGFVLDSQDAATAADLVEKALLSNDQLSPRKRIIELYNINIRKAKIERVIDSLLFKKVDD